MNAAGVIYSSEIMHRRLFPVRYRFVYRIFSMLLDIDRIDELARHTAVFSRNRWNIFSFYDADHVGSGANSARGWIDTILRRAGHDPAAGRVRLLCFPRLLGYTFNPLSIWFCEDPLGRLQLVVCEVRNTFGERHCYLLSGSLDRPLGWPVRAHRSKSFHVSPFIGMSAEYRFRLSQPGATLQVLIREYQDERLMLVAAQTGHAKPFTSENLLRESLRVPLLTFKVMAGIHWEALKIWLKGARFHTKPPAPKQEVS
ncbi:MAG: DUF1365 domain-containing protein [Thiotrichales bacterium]